MTGAYLRVMRDGKWASIEIEHLTKDERSAFFDDKTANQVLMWLDAVCQKLSEVENQYFTSEEPNDPTPETI